MPEKPYLGVVCTRTHHALKVDRKIAVNDLRLYACSCGGVLIGNGVAVVRAKAIDQRFPLQEEAA